MLGGAAGHAHSAHPGALGWTAEAINAEAKSTQTASSTTEAARTPALSPPWP